MDAQLAEHGTTIMTFTASMLVNQARIDLERRARNLARPKNENGHFVGPAVRYGFKPAHLRGADGPAKVLERALKVAGTLRAPDSPLGRALLYKDADLLAQALEMAMEKPS